MECVARAGAAVGRGWRRRRRFSRSGGRSRVPFNVEGVREILDFLLQLDGHIGAIVFDARVNGRISMIGNRRASALHVNSDLCPEFGVALHRLRVVLGHLRGLSHGSSVFLDWLRVPCGIQLALATLHHREILLQSKHGGASCEEACKLKGNAPVDWKSC